MPIVSQAPLCTAVLPWGALRWGNLPRSCLWKEGISLPLLLLLSSLVLSLATGTAGTAVNSPPPANTGTPAPSPYPFPTSGEAPSGSDPVSSPLSSNLTFPTTTSIPLNSKALIPSDSSVFPVGSLCYTCDNIPANAMPTTGSCTLNCAGPCCTMLWSVVDGTGKYQSGDCTSGECLGALSAYPHSVAVVLAGLAVALGQVLLF